MSKTARRALHELPVVYLPKNGIQHLITDHAAAYLGMHPKAFIRLAIELSVKPDGKLGKNNLYSVATLKVIDGQRAQIRRPKQIDTGVTAD